MGFQSDLAARSCHISSDFDVLEVRQTPWPFLKNLKMNRQPEQVQIYKSWSKIKKPGFLFSVCTQIETNYITEQTAHIRLQFVSIDHAGTLRLRTCIFKSSVNKKSDSSSSVRAHPLCTPIAHKLPVEPGFHGSDVICVTYCSSVQLLWWKMAVWERRPVRAKNRSVWGGGDHVGWSVTDRWFRIISKK